MSIISSVLDSDVTQADGRRSIDETHTDNVGITWRFSYLGAANVNAAANLGTHAAMLAAAITQGEIDRNVGQVLTLGSFAVPTFVYSTPAANAAALRSAYFSATQTQAIMAGDFLSTLTDGQLQTAFGLTAPQVATLRANKLTPAATAAATIRASTGA